MTGETDNLKSWFRTGEDCLGIEEIDRYEHGGMQGEERARVETHLERCARCRTELSLMKRFEAAAPAEAEAEAVAWITSRLREGAGGMQGEAMAPASPGRMIPPREPAPWWKRLFPTPTAVRWAFAAAGLAVLAAALPLLYERSVNGPLPSIDTTQTVVRSGAVEVRSPVGDVSTVPERLEWEPVPGAAGYEAVLLEVDKTEVWNGKTSEPFMPVTQPLRELLVPGKTLLWQVKALDAEEREIGRSALVRLRIEPGSKR